LVANVSRENLNLDTATYGKDEKYWPPTELDDAVPVSAAHLVPTPTYEQAQAQAQAESQRQQQQEQTLARTSAELGVAAPLAG
jgi:hypothetical protein